MLSQYRTGAGMIRDRSIGPRLPPRLDPPLRDLARSCAPHPNRLFDRVTGASVETQTHPSHCLLSRREQFHSSILRKAYNPGGSSQRRIRLPDEVLRHARDGSVSKSRLGCGKADFRGARQTWCCIGGFQGLLTMLWKFLQRVRIVLLGGLYSSACLRPGASHSPQIQD